MKRILSLVLALSLFAFCAAFVSAQQGAALLEGRQTPDAKAGLRSDRAVARRLFAPITDELNLTNDQESQIAQMILDLAVRADPMIKKLDEVDDQIAAATVAETFEEAKIKDLSLQEATILAQLIAMKARVNANILQLLNRTQRSMVWQQFRAKPHMEANLGGISIY